MVGKNIQWEEDLLENKWPLHLCATVDWNGFTREYVVTFKAILLEMLSCLPKLVISYFWISKGMLLRPVSLDSNVFLWHSHMFELLSWFRSAQLEAFLWIDLPPPCLPLLVKPHLHLLQHLKARDSIVVFIFRQIFVVILTNNFSIVNIELLLGKLTSLQKWQKLVKEVKIIN